MESTQTEFISVINSILMLVDYNPDMLNQVRSGNRSAVRDAAVTSAKAASILNVPVILTDQEGSADYIKEIKEIFPAQAIITRKSGLTDAFADEAVYWSLKKLKREKLIISGLLTSESFAETALHAVQEGYDVFGLIDACGDISSERHNYGLHMMLKAGITPITWMSLASEWMNGWAEPAYSDAEEMAGKYNVMLSYLSRQ